MNSKKNLLKQFVICLISLIAGITSSFSSAVILEGLAFEPGGILFVTLFIILTAAFFVSQFICFAIVTGVYSFIKNKSENPTLEEDKMLVRNPEKIEKLKSTIKIR